MNKTHWNTIIDTKFLSGEEILDQDIIVTILDFVREDVISENGHKENCGVLKLKETKPIILNKTNAKRIASILNSPYKEDWIGKKIQLTTEKVKAFGKLWNAIRVYETLPIISRSQEIICNDCKKTITGYNQYSAIELAHASKQRYGVEICIECGNKRKELQNGKTNK